MEKLRAWHVPKVPMKAFYVNVETPEEAAKVLSLLSQYDSFQFKNHVRDGGFTAQGLEKWCEKEHEWQEWYSEGRLDIRTYAKKLKMM